jgi:site-specific DNA-cytosine methylase
VRRDWRKFPQEAHVLSGDSSRYRRFTPEEIAILQGFDPSVIALDGLTDRQKIASLGDAVPPPLARAVAEAIDSLWTWRSETALEICAGIGGLAEGAKSIGLQHLQLIDFSPESGSLLKKRWTTDQVTVADVRSFDFSAFRGKVGLLSGGPPCQPWSRSGLQRGEEDERDLFGALPEFVAQCEPEVFLFENVPGLVSGQNRNYLESAVRSLRQPRPGLLYGVLAGTLNAADFGVPQVRHRVFVVGFRDSPGALAYKCFDKAAELRTHRDPSISTTSPAWVTIGEALKGRRDPGGWRKWVNN